MILKLIGLNQNECSTFLFNDYLCKSVMSSLCTIYSFESLLFNESVESLHKSNLMIPKQIGLNKSNYLKFVFSNYKGIQYVQKQHCNVQFVNDLLFLSRSSVSQLNHFTNQSK